MATQDEGQTSSHLCDTADTLHMKKMLEAARLTRWISQIATVRLIAGFSLATKKLGDSEVTASSLEEKNLPAYLLPESIF